MDDKYGALTFTRIYSGRVKKGDTVLNTFTGKTERIGRIVEMHADERIELGDLSDLVDGELRCFENVGRDGIVVCRVSIISNACAL